MRAATGTCKTKKLQWLEPTRSQQRPWQINTTSDRLRISTNQCNQTLFAYTHVRIMTRGCTNMLALYISKRLISNPTTKSLSLSVGAPSRTVDSSLNPHIRNITNDAVLWTRALNLQGLQHGCVIHCQRSNDNCRGQHTGGRDCRKGPIRRRTKRGPLATVGQAFYNN